MENDKYDQLEELRSLAIQTREATEFALKIANIAQTHVNQTEKLRQALLLQKEGSSTYYKLLDNARDNVSKAAFYTDMAAMINDHRNQLQSQVEELEKKIRSAQSDE